ncbi:hypothetical protein TI39_contig636g00003 [Zymoseptoria brevis]|uniref:Uncharacterized protein n=1 Tax=Zymoseptoria brevis TaxID=1047168 RepID=A0A0F4GH86_9PEZI|nr:hypothetical protein TI39_contig636g00003 [Zymoseptoria brevis]
MLSHHRFHALVVLGAVLQLPFAVMAEVPTCDPLPDHANYSGDHGLDKNGAWCPYDDNHFMKPLGVGCQHDSECQQGPNRKSIYPYTNGKDWMSINFDVILTEGFGICDSDGQGGTVCNAVIPPIDAHPGGPPQPNPGPGSDPKSTCREIISKGGDTGIDVVNGCSIDYKGTRILQCMLTCNGSPSCDPSDDPNEVHKYLEQFPAC